jgi:hypothetical protein
MEFVDGPSLEDVLHKKGILKEPPRSRSSGQVAQALDYAWTHKIIHRDIKPQNVMLSQERTVKLCDLGLSKDVTSDISLTDDRLGQLLPALRLARAGAGPRDMDIRSDVYSLGVSLFQMLCGELPFKGNAPGQFLIQHVTKAPARSPLEESEDLVVGERPDPADAAEGGEGPPDARGHRQGHHAVAQRAGAEEGMSRTASRLFLAVLAISALYALFLVAGRRVPTNDALFEPGGIFLLHVPFRAASILGMMLEELLLLVGVWRLATRYFPSPKTRFFVSVAALGSSLWVDPAAPNLRLLAALPLLVALLHDALETPSWRPLAMAGSLVVLQAAGKAPALAVLAPAAALIYFSAAAVLYRYPLIARLRERAWGIREGAGAAVVIVLVLAVARLTGTSSPDSLRLGRLPDLFLGISPSPEIAAFCGFLTLAFAALALPLVGKRLGLILAALAAMVTAWSPALPLLRLFVILLSGFGFQGMIDGRLRGGSVRAAALMLALLSLALSGARGTDPGGPPRCCSRSRT